MSLNCSFFLFLSYISYSNQTPNTGTSHPAHPSSFPFLSRAVAYAVKDFFSGARAAPGFQKHGKAKVTPGNGPIDSLALVVGP
jgi:hypothetical protein